MDAFSRASPSSYGRGKRVFHARHYPLMYDSAKDGRERGGAHVFARIQRSCPRLDERCWHCLRFHHFAQGTFGASTHQVGYGVLRVQHVPWVWPKARYHGHPWLFVRALSRHQRATAPHRCQTGRQRLRHPAPRPLGASSPATNSHDRRGTCMSVWTGQRRPSSRDRALQRAKKASNTNRITSPQRMSAQRA